MPQNIITTKLFNSNLGGVREEVIWPPSFNNSLIISFNNSETVKAVILAFWGIKKHSIKDICHKFSIPYSLQSPDIGQNSDGGISNFWIPGQSLIKENCHNSRTSDDKNIKLAPVTDFKNVKKSWWRRHVKIL